jgi:choline dehydrogenase-like flavoprotein
MDRPMRVRGPSVFDLVLANVATAVGFGVLVWSAGALVLGRTLLPAQTVLAGSLAGLGVAAGLSLILGAGGQRASLDLGLLLLAVLGVALIVAGVVEGALGSILSGVVMGLARTALGAVRSAAVRAGYRPVFFRTGEFRTMVATVETILDADGREAIPPERAAANTDRLLAAIDAPLTDQVKLLFWALEWVVPALVIFRPVPFTMLGPDARRRLMETLIAPQGPLAWLVKTPFRTVARSLKVLACAGYYGDPVSMRAIGFREFEDSPRGRGKDLTPRHYPDPAERTGESGAPAREAPACHRTGVVAATDVDAVVIGSGASGSVMAYELIRRGLRVAMIERGRREDPRTFEHSEFAMFPRLYKDGGMQTAADRNTAIFQGATVGGSTVINNAIWLRPPQLERVLSEWKALGADVPQTELVSAYEELEHALHVSPVPLRVANPGTELFLRGAKESGEVLKNNRDGCLGCGWCNYGCKYNRKTSMLVTYIPWAEARGLELRDQVMDARIVRDGGHVVGVEGTRRADGDERATRVAYTCKKVIVCAGAIGSSAVLLQNGITAGENVGKRLHVLGGLFVTGDMGRIVDGFDGIGLTCMDNGDHDYVLESYFAPPLAFSIRLGGWLHAHFDRAERYRHFIDGGVMIGTDPHYGTVSLSGGEPTIDLRPPSADIELLKEGLKHMARIYFAAGARRVYPSTFKYIDLTRETYESVIEREITTVDDVLFGSAHPQGGNVMNCDPARGVVDETFKVHGIDGLYVADTSVWPSNIRANCQATAMAMSHYAAGHVAT